MSKQAAPLAVQESFEVVFGQLVFQNTTARDNAQTRITNVLASRPRFRDAEATIDPVRAGKYGVGPALSVTLRMASRSDANAIWDDISGSTALNALRSLSIITQSSVTFDSETGEQTVNVIHKLTVPAAPDDF